MVRMQRAFLAAVEEPIDFVITWVDGDDLDWQAIKDQFSGGGQEGVDASVRRYRDWGLLRYLFRSIEAFAPWVRKVFFVTCGHVPQWLDFNAEKLVVVKHSDYMPERYLPTFNSHPIELNLHRIEGLSENFVYFNDDLFLIRPVKPELFFKRGKPVYWPALHGIVPWGGTGVMAHVYVNVASAVNRHYDYRAQLAANRSKFFNPARVGVKTVLENVYCAQHNSLPGFRAAHLPTPLLKSTMAEVWAAEPDLLERSSMNKFRSAADVSQYVFWYWQIMKGDFEPIAGKRLGRWFTIGPDTERIVEAVAHQSYPMICANDMGDLLEGEFEETRRVLAGAFERLLPDKSTFEK